MPSKSKDKISPAKKNKKQNGGVPQFKVIPTNPSVDNLHNLVNVAPTLLEQATRLNTKPQETVKQITKDEFNRNASISDILSNPLTALKYKLHNQQIPANFAKADRNIYDNALDVVNPLTYTKAIGNTVNRVTHPVNTVNQLIDNPIKNGYAMASDALAPLVAYGVVSKIPAVAKTLGSFDIVDNINYAINKPSTIENIKPKWFNKELGSALPASGNFNAGVYDLKRFPGYVAKIEHPVSVGGDMGFYDYDKFNFVDAMRNIPDNAPISKVYNQLSLPDGNSRALVMRKLNGLSPGQLQPEDYLSLPKHAITDLYNNLKLLKNNNLAFDYMGDNYLYDPSKQQFQLLDINPAFPSTDQASTLWNKDILRNVSSYNKSLTPNDVKGVITDKLIEDYGRSLFHTLYGEGADFNDINQAKNDGGTYLKTAVNNYTKGLVEFKTGGKMKNNKKLKKFQFAGQNPCGEGTQWDANSMQCVPVSNPNKPQQYKQDYSGESTNFIPSAYTDGNGKVTPGQTTPLLDLSHNPDNNLLDAYLNGATTPDQYKQQLNNNSYNPNKSFVFNPNAGSQDSRGTFIPYQNVVPDALDKGFNLDSDGKYRKKQITTDNGILGYSDGFKALNLDLDLTQGIANMFNDAKTIQKEKYNIQKARYNTAQYNPYEQGLNQVGVYKAGGKTSTLTDKQLAAAMLNSGRKLTDKEKKHFEYVLAGRIPMDGHIEDPEPEGTYQVGGDVKRAYNPNLAKDDKAFQAWYKANTLEGKNNIPYNNSLDYDYYSYYKNGDYKNYKGGHFPDTYKRPIHETFSNESIYSTPENPGGSWNDEQYNPNGQFQYQSGGQSPIKINPKHKGLFTKEAKVAGMSVQQYAAHVLANKDKYSADIVKRANFAHNFAHQNGGNITNTGYLPNSPDRFNPYNIIPSNLITMDNVSHDIMAYPDKGNPKLMKKNSGLHKFKGAKYVTEVPIYQNGGTDAAPTQLRVSPQTMREWNRFIDYAKAKGISGSPDLDVRDKNLGQQIMNEYIQQHPNSTLNYNQVADIQAELQRYRQQTLNKIQAGKGMLAPGMTPDNFMTGISKVDGWLGSRTSSYKFPEAYIRTYTPTGTNTQDVGLAATANLQTGGTPISQSVDPNQANAETEEGEIIQQNNGNIVKTPEDAGTHEEGGSLQPNVDRVLEDTADKRKDPVSKLLRITPTEAYSITGFKPKGTVTHSKLYEQATQFYDKKLKTIENKIKSNLDYVKNNGGKYAQNSLDQNLKLLQTLPTKAQLFDTIFNHQEQVKQANGIDDNTVQQQNGGKVKFAVGGVYPEPVDPYAGGKTKKGKTTPTGMDNAFSFDGGLDAYKALWKKAGLNLDSYKTNADAQAAVYDFLLQNNPDAIRNMWKTYGDTAAGIKAGLPSTFDDNFLNDPQNLQKLKQGYVDNLLGVRTLTPKMLPGITVNTNTPNTVNNRPDVNIQYDKPQSNNSNEFNYPLKWYDIAGNIDNYLSSSERVPVSFEQLQRQPIQAHELNPQPTLDANQGDFNAALQTLPVNGVGYANTANLLANKYKVNNEVLGTYADKNQQIHDSVDRYNNEAKYQLDTANMGLRDRAVQQQLQAMEVERQSKLNAFDDYLTKLAQNKQFNLNGNLALQLTPYFNQEGKFNGNKYILKTSGDGGVNVFDKNTGRYVQTVYRDENGQLKSSKETTVKNVK